MQAKPTYSVIDWRCTNEAVRRPHLYNHSWTRLWGGSGVNMKVLPKWLEKPGPIACTLLGDVASTKAACPKMGSGTLVTMLGARPVQSECTRRRLGR